MMQIDEEAEADQAVAGEWALLAAMFRTILQDAHSADGMKRASVDRFLNENGPEWWETELGLPDGFATTLRRRLTRPARCTTHRDQSHRP